MSSSAHSPPPSALRHVGVAAFACALTVCTIGSATFIILHRVEKQREKDRVLAYVASLQYRSIDQLNEIADKLRTQPAQAARVLPAMLKEARNPAARAESRLAALRVAGQFAADEPRIAEALFKLRTAGDEGIAAQAVAALGRVRPESKAAEYLGGCIDDHVVPAVMDVACEQLVRMGDAGRSALRPRRDRLSPQRRAWLVGLVLDRRPVDADVWLRFLADEFNVPAAARALESLHESASRPGAVTGS